MIPVGDYRPDLPDFQNPGATRALNVLPSATSYRPLSGLVAYSNALAGRCQGAFATRDSSANVFNFAGDANHLYRLDGTSWTDVTRAEVASKGADIASAATVDLGAATGDFVDVTGMATITSLGTVSEGIRRTVRFRGALTLTHNATSFILPGGADITTADGDIARFRSLGAGKWVCEGYSRANGSILGKVATADIADGAVATVKVADGAVSKAKIAIDQQVPAGAVMAFAMSTVPTGWLLCDGAAVSRETYADLFTAIGTTFGAGDESTTFNVPDLRGRVVAGKDDMGGTAAERLTDSGTGNPGIDGTELGAAGGSDRHVLTVAQMPFHRHTLGKGPEDGVIGATIARTAANAGGNFNTSFEGSDEAHPNVQPTIVLSYCIKY